MSNHLTMPVIGRAAVRTVMEGVRVDVSVVVVVGHDDRPHLSTFLAAWRETEGSGLLEDLSVELVIVDHTADGDLAVPGHTCVRPATVSRGDAWLAGLSASTGRYVAMREAPAELWPAGLVRQAAHLDSNEDIDIVSCRYGLRLDGDLRHAIDPSQDGDNPPPGWRGTLMARRAALATIRRTAFYPAELELFRRVR